MTAEVTRWCRARFGHWAGVVWEVALAGWKVGRLKVLGVRTSSSLKWRYLSRSVGCPLFDRPKSRTTQYWLTAFASPGLVSLRLKVGYLPSFRLLQHLDTS